MRVASRAIETRDFATPVVVRLDARRSGGVALPDGVYRLRRQALPYVRLVKPLLDRAGALVLLVLLSPLMALVALAVRVSLGRPIFYSQTRVGLGGREFELLKFRTMRTDRRSGVDRRGEARPGAADRRQTHKSPHDPRHTRMGRVLRAFRLDELPQLVHVLRGEMSLVGPRPELASVVAGYEPWQHRRHAVRPGLTGLWQVTSTADEAAEMSQHVDVDIRYVDTVSLTTDLRIMAATLPAMLRRPGV